MLIWALIPALVGGCRQAAERGELYDTAPVTVHQADSVFVRSGSIGRDTVLLPDGSRVILNPGSEIGYDSLFGRREVRLDGDAYFDIRPLPGKAFGVHTRNLVLEGAGALRITAFAKDEGESVEVLEGRIHAAKSYTSPDHEPDTLSAGDMVMINRSIDLMEKETFDTSTLLAWRSDTLVIAALSPDNVVRLLQDWFGVTVNVHGTAGDITLRGIFPQARLDAVLDTLSAQGKFRYVVRKNTVEIVY
jgi:transmembrane sensor